MCRRIFHLFHFLRFAVTACWRLGSFLQEAQREDERCRWRCSLITASSRTERSNREGGDFGCVRLPFRLRWVFTRSHETNGASSASLPSPIVCRSCRLSFVRCVWDLRIPRSKRRNRPLKSHRTLFSYIPARPPVIFWLFTVDSSEIASISPPFPYSPLPIRSVF